MKNILRVVLWLVPAALAIIGPSSALACSYPPAESIALTWRPDLVHDTGRQVCKKGQATAFAASRMLPW